ncbi:MAG: MASE1 domain-containing protein [Longimicrobiales bacterium]
MPLSNRWKSVLVNTLLGVAYAVIGYLTLRLGETGGVELRRVIWLPSGIAVATGLLVRFPVWPGVAAAGALVTAATGGSPLYVMGTALANGLEVGASVAVLRRVGFRTSMNRVSDVLILLGLAAGVAAFLASLLSVSALALVGGVPEGAFVRLWMMWWLTHGMGMLVVVPVVLTSLHGRREAFRRPFEFVGVLLCIGVAAWVPFVSDPASPISRLFFLPFPFLLWAAIRMGMSGAALGTLVVTGAAMTAAVLDWGPLVGGTPNQTLVLTWFYSNVVVIATLISAAIVVGWREARDAHRLEERRLRAVLDATDQGIVVTDADGSVTHVNRAVATIWPGEAELPALDAPIDEALAGLRARLTGARTEAPELSDDLKGGAASGVVELVGGHVWEVDTDQLSEPEIRGGRIWSFRDITQRIRVEEERQRLEARILHGQKLESLGVLAGGIAHDFNNLLMSIMGRAELLSFSEGLEDEDRESLDAILRTSTRAAELCRQMLAYAGKRAFDVQHMDLSDCAREIEELLRVSVSRDVQFQLDLTDEPLPVEGDVTQLRQVFMNLVTNASEAVAATGRGGRVLVRTEVAMLGPRWFSEAVVREEGAAGVYGVVEIRDNGVGMDEHTSARIFDPFFSRKGNGRGLGLAVTLGVIRSHRGALRVESELGKGTVFRVALPLAEARALTAVPEVTPAPSEGFPGRTVLVVDDEDLVRQVVARMLESLGFRVLQADGGDRALEILASNPDVSLMLLDLMMPRMSGPETLRAMEARGIHVPVLVASGYSAESVLDDPGVAGFVQKPFRKDTLERALAEVLAVGA